MTGERGGDGFDGPRDDSLAGPRDDPLAGPRDDPLVAVSPVDGRYASRTAPLVPFASEAALMRARVRVEIEYLLALGALDVTPFEISDEDATALRSVPASFDRADAREVKRIETEGDDARPATNHDVKAVEYFVRDRLADLDRTDLRPWVHFALTSEDVNNLAHRLLLRDALSAVIEPAIAEVREALLELAKAHRDLPMLARTHGQPATPTTFGKEMAVFAARLGRAHGRVRNAGDGLAGKLAGASGTYAAHVAAYPDVDWRAVAREFVESLGLDHTPLATQVNPCDDLAAVFDALRGVNNVLLDLDRDVWRYVSDRYLGQAATAGETGSSTMPHKVNPIDFENSEGNLSKANADLTFLADYVTTSRLQRDLSDSTVKRTIGGTLAHCLIGYTKCADGLAKVVPNESVMHEELAENPAVLGEAVQTVLRREGYDDAYERVKAATRGRTVAAEDLRALVRDLDLDEATHEYLLGLEPADYVGLAAELVDDLE